jgi:hypothetical protein
MYTVYSVLLSPLWLKSVPGWSAISVSTFQVSRVGQMVWFGSLSAISQLASRGGGMGSWATLCLHSVTQPYTTCPRWREQGGGLRSLPLGLVDLSRRYFNDHIFIPSWLLSGPRMRSLRMRMSLSISYSVCLESLPPLSFFALRLTLLKSQNCNCNFSVRCSFFVIWFTQFHE